MSYSLGGPLGLNLGEQCVQSMAAHGPMLTGESGGSLSRVLTPEELEKASHMKSFRSWMVKDREQKLLRNPGKNIVLRKCHKRGTGQSKK